MSAIEVEAFGGIMPLLSPRKLPTFGAQLARDCLFFGTDLRPLREPVSQAGLGFTASRLFKYRFQGQGTWLAWPQGMTIDVMPSPIAQDKLGRLYWSRMNPSAMLDTDDGYPRVASQPTQLAITNNASSIRRLGIPAPTVAPTITETQVASSAQPVTMSQTSPITVTTAGAHPFKDGQRVLITFTPEPVANPDGTVPNMGALNGREFVLTNVETTSFDLRGTDGALFTPFTSNTGVKIERVYADADLETRAYVYTYVSDWGEEGPPSPPSTPGDVRYDSTVNVTCASTIASPFNGYVNRVRVYRSASGTTGAQFFFVKEMAVSPPTAVVVVDNVQAIGLGELLPSEDWTPPPNHLQGLTAMPNGFAVGFVRNTLYVCEAYMPHAWPFKYTKTTEDDIVGLAVFGQTLVIATKGKPYIAGGTDPASLSMSKLDAYAPCIGKGSVCSVGIGVVFATYDGLVLVDGGTPKVLTEGYVSKDEWAVMWEAGMQAIFQDGHLIALSTNANKTLLMRVNAGKLDIATANLQGTAPATDPDDDSMQFCAGTSRVKYDAGAARTMTWRSKVFALPHAGSLGCGRVFADAYPVTLTIGYSNLQPGTGQPSAMISDTYSVTVAGPEVFRLRSDFLSREWEVTVAASAGVQAVALAEFMDELR